MHQTASFHENEFASIYSIQSYIYTRHVFFAHLSFQTHDPTQPTKNNNFRPIPDPIQHNPTQPNPRVNPTNGQLWSGHHFLIIRSIALFLCHLLVVVLLLLLLSILCRSAWIGRSRPSVCLSVCPQISQKRIITKCSNLVQGMILGYTRSDIILGLKGQGSRSQDQ